MDNDLSKFLNDLEYLPRYIRDFHDQKDLFKCIHKLVAYEKSLDNLNWVNCHVYTIDFFLWFMARHGYTLQKSKKKIQFENLDTTLEQDKNERIENLKSIFNRDEDQSKNNREA